MQSRSPFLAQCLKNRTATYGELFDLENDPDELHNLWDDPASRPLRDALRIELLDEIMRTDTSAPPDQPGLIRQLWKQPRLFRNPVDKGVFRGIIPL